MSRIQSSIGLISGIPIQETVDKLMAVAGRPRDLLVARTKELQSEQLAINALTSRVLSFQFALNKLKSASIFAAATATSSKPEVLSATVPTGATPLVGSYQFTPLQTAAAHSLITGPFANISQGLGTGSFQFAFGGQVNRGIALSELNGGTGVPAGQIRITDRSGASATIDLRSARTVDDVLAAINGSTTINVTADAVGDALRLTDNTGGAGTLSVQELVGGTTAAALGLAGISTGSASATGSDVYRLHVGTRLATLNDGNGVNLLDGIADLEVELADESVLQIDLGNATTLGGVLDAINASSPTKLTATIAADGNRIELSDLTTGAGTFQASSFGAGTAAEGLGLTVAQSSGIITGRRLVSGLGDTLLSTLNGGRGYEALGELAITDRAGASDTVDLTTAETLQEVLDAINAATVQVTASVNAARNGIKITDTSGGSGDLTIASNDPTNTAEALSIAVDEAVGAIDSGSLHRQFLSRDTLLSSLNGGRGVKLGDFYVTDSAGVKKVVDLNPPGNEASTLGDVIDTLNALTNGVTAQINDTGDGILLIDTAAGSGSLTVTEVGNGTTAADLRLLGTSTTVDIEGVPTKVIDGATTFSIDVSDLDQSAESISLSTLNGGAGVDQGLFNVVASNGQNFVVNLGAAGDEAFTVGDVTDKINAAADAKGISVTAAINSAGTGIVLTDTAGGSEKLTVADLGSSTAATDLKLAATATGTTINGFGLFPATTGQAAAVDSLAARINAFRAGVTASTFFDGAGYRLALTADKTGAGIEILVDTSEVSFAFEEVSRPRDAALVVGAGVASGGLVVTSANNQFAGVVAGLDLTVKQASTEPIRVDVELDTDPLTTAVGELVDSYNALREDLAELTSFDPETLTTGILFGRSAALRVDSDLSHLISGRFLGIGQFESLEEIGVSLDDQGKLSIDEDQLLDAFANDPTALEQFFRDQESGIVAKFTSVANQLASGEQSLLSTQSETLTDKIERNQLRLEQFSAQLERQRERMLFEFARLEQTISRFQSNFSALQTLAAIPPLTTTRRGN
ncbi:MAG: flagellar filament capping protein FliD [Pirellulales bacterium]